MILAIKILMTMKLMLILLMLILVMITLMMTMMIIMIRIIMMVKMMIIMMHATAAAADGDYDDYHDGVIKWKHFPRYWPFVRGIHRSLVNSPHKGQWREALVFSTIGAWTNDWVNNRDAGHLRRHRAHYDVTVIDIRDNCSDMVWIWWWLW